ncbi:DEAD/DEAH box helicase [Pedobacter sp. SYSU D00535]|uniref:DEAD/DEAH box helicase n=1 Tax=Pedobacter sp. SYSU D00535 TaxID=2810308 RepID=UPI001A95C712|nr:DEAD/DEAH box helicase [Pedobacter sp. SYSU D00535]
MNEQRTSLEQHRTVIAPFDIQLLNEVYIQIHGAEAFYPSPRSLTDLVAEEAEIDSIFFIDQSLPNPVAVTVTIREESLLVGCSCSFSGPKLCQFQAKALYNIVKKPDLRLFFDKQVRNEKLKKFAEPYGLENEKELEQYFELALASDRLSIKPRLKGLIPVTKESNLQLREQLTKAHKPARLLNADTEKKEHFLVLRQHKYYRHLLVQLAEAEITASGKIRAPIQQLASAEFVWKAEDPAEAKFYTAVSLFENPVQKEPSQFLIDGLKLILKNPLNLRIYQHFLNISEGLIPKALKQMHFGEVLSDLKLSVSKEGAFHTIRAWISINDINTPLEDVELKFDYFVDLGGELHLIGNLNTLKLFTLFKQNDYELKVHESKFAEFRESFLAKLEEDVSVRYTYLKPATAEQLKENSFDEPPRKLVYLTDSDPYIDLEPVMRYGREEIAILSRRQIYASGIHGDAFYVQRDNQAEFEFISQLARQHPNFLEQLEDGIPYFYLRKDRFLQEDWFLNAFEEWEKMGIEVLGFNKIRNNKLSQYKAKVGVQIKSGLNWFNVDVEVKYGKKKASLKQIQKAVKNKSKYVQLDDGTLGLLPDEWLEKLKRFFDATDYMDDAFAIPKSNFLLINQLFEEEVLPNDIRIELDELHHSLNSFESIKEVEVPAGFRGELREYQQQGLNWLNFLDDYNFGACLADDMGLGKTVQVIAFILLQKQKRGPSCNLLVVPTSLIFNWQQEIAKFAPDLTAYTLHGAGRVTEISSLADYDIVITTYGTLLSDINILKKFDFNYAVLDESQNIKNPESQRYKAARLLKARNRIILTGTPVENNTFDLYAQLSFACPGLLGSKQYFRDVYSTPIDKFEDRTRATELQNLIKPFILRRTKKQVAAELPEKTEMILYCEMQEPQRKVYERYEQEIRDYIEGIPNDDIAKNAIHVLRSLTKLRQICDSPLLLHEPMLDEIGSSKIEALLEQISAKSNNHKILVFSQFVTMLDLVKKELEKRNISFSYLSGATRDRQSAVEAFQNNAGVRVFLVSLKAGGTGLNLTKADYVYLLDPWWNPAVESQAIDRVYRIGQKKKVVAVRMICPNTVEEKILQLQESKSLLAEKLIDAEGSFFQSLTKQDLLKLLSPTVPKSLR